jgi:hypothetical protein
LQLYNFSVKFSAYLKPSRGKTFAEHWTRQDVSKQDVMRKKKHTEQSIQYRDRQAQLNNTDGRKHKAFAMNLQAARSEHTPK